MEEAAAEARERGEGAAMVTDDVRREALEVDDG